VCGNDAALAAHVDHTLAIMDRQSLASQPRLVLKTLASATAKPVELVLERGTHFYMDQNERVAHGGSK
jgi:hypothetical protein